MTHRDRQPGLGLTLIAAIIAAIAGAIALLNPDSGVAGTIGAGLALFGALAVAAASAVILFVVMLRLEGRRPHGLRRRSARQGRSLMRRITACPTHLRRSV